MSQCKEADRLFMLGQDEKVEMMEIAVERDIGKTAQGQSLSAEKN